MENFCIEPFKKIETIHVKASDEPLFINITTWEQGVTYSIIPENELLVYMPYWTSNPKMMAGSQLLSSYFIFNGTTATTKIAGSLSQIYGTNNEYRVKNLSIHVQEVLKNPIDELFGKLLLIDSSRNLQSFFYVLGAKGLDSLFVTYPVNRSPEDFVPSIRMDLPKAIVYISEHDDDKFIMNIADSMFFENPELRVEIYGGWPPVSNETLLATYTPRNYESALPQRFSGIIRTFLFHRAVEMEVRFFSFLESYTFMKKIDKTGFIRTNWMDGSEVKTTTLDTEKKLSSNDYYYDDSSNSIFSFTFSFRTGCVPTARLNITTIIDEERQLHSYFCGTTEEMKLFSKDVYVTLEGDAVVDYILQNGVERRLFLFLLLILIFN